jgi:hypothetical protein
MAGAGRPDRRRWRWRGLAVGSAVGIIGATTAATLTQRLFGHPALDLLLGVSVGVVVLAAGQGIVAVSGTVLRALRPPHVPAHRRSRPAWIVAYPAVLSVLVSVQHVIDRPVPRIAGVPAMTASRWRPAPCSSAHVAGRGRSPARPLRLVAIRTAHRDSLPPVDRVATAGEWGFGIRGVVALAPSHGLWVPAGASRTLDGVSCLLVQGAYDADLPPLLGLQQYAQVDVADAPGTSKALAYLQRADHGQFNQVWGRGDIGPLDTALLVRGPLLSGAEQRLAAKVLVTGFLSAVLQDAVEPLRLTSSRRSSLMCYS